MAIYKCKMCGGDLNIGAEAVVVECDYCGTAQTVPAADNEKKLNLFNRANRLRLNSEFDKAAGIYENIIAEFPEEAEAYWGLCLCNYGIEYVDDPATAKKVPTCHRASFEKLASDENFNMVMEYADVVAQKIYRDEAREIDRIMEEILSVSKNEKPYDVFICYKETDDKGERTIDSVLAQDVYDALTTKGLKVFFARITLEDKLGKMYEPYIFAALNSAKVMLAIGTKYEHFHAVWVKNEWSRFLKIMAKDKSKALIPCYKDMDAYDMPEEFKALQAQDMGKIGFMQDLIRGVEKITSEGYSVGKQSNAGDSFNYNSEADNIVNIGFMDLQAGNQKKAEMQFRSALEKDINNVMAYIGLCLTDSVNDKEREIYTAKINVLSPHICEAERKIIFNNRQLLIKYVIAFIRFFSGERLKAAFKQDKDLLHEPVFFTKDEDYPYNNSILNYAVNELNDIYAIKFLLDIGVNPNKSKSDCNENREGNYVLYDAIYTANTDIIRLLLKAGADPNKITISSGEEYSVLGHAIRNTKDIGIIKLLFESGANPNIIEHRIDDKGKPYERAVFIDVIKVAKSIGMVKLFIEYGVNTNMIVTNGTNRECSPLDEAVCIKNTEIVRLLLEAGADPNRVCELIGHDGKPIKNASYREPILAKAIMNSDKIEIVDLLLEHGANWDENIIRYGGKPKTIRKYPFNKYHYHPSEYWKALRSKGWKGSIF